MKKLLLIGGGGHCKSVIDSLKSKYNEFDEIAIIDRNTALVNQGINVIGKDQDLKYLFSKGYNYAFVTVGSVGNPSVRIKLYNLIKEIGYIIPTIIDRSSIVSSNAELCEGVFVGKGAIINAGTKIGNCSIINTGAVVEHDCKIGSFVHVAPGSVLCGNVQVGNNSHIGANATVIQGMQVGKNSIVGAGTVVIHSIGDEATVIGNPGRMKGEDNI